MKPLSQIDMIEATRLTREGRLNEAMAVLREAFRCTSAASVPPGAEDVRQPTPRPGAPEFIDLVPPSATTGESWTAPQSRQAPADGTSGNEEAPRAPRNGGGEQSESGRLRVFPGLHTPIPSVGRRATVLPDGARFEERAFTNDAGSRQYKLYIPSSFAGQPLPLVVMLHGCTQSPDDFAAGTRMNVLAEEFTFLVAYPAQSQSANASKCWNWFRPVDQLRGQGEPSLIAGIAQQIMQEYPIAPSKVCVAGLSAGGAAAAIMGATYPDIFSAVGVHSGLACGAATDIPSAFEAMRQGGAGAIGRPFRQGDTSDSVPTIVFHGDRDTIVSPINGDHVIKQAKAGAELQRTISCGCSQGGIRYTCTVEKDPSGRTVLEHWMLHGCGHAWSGGSADGSYTEPRGPDASREMLRFFLHHASSNATVP
jgi:poly(hydroxyalkanoate) depolymerase family esterase